MGLKLRPVPHTPLEYLSAFARRRPINTLERCVVGVSTLVPPVLGVNFPPHSKFERSPPTNPTFHLFLRPTSHLPPIFRSNFLPHLKLACSLMCGKTWEVDPKKLVGGWPKKIGGRWDWWKVDPQNRWD